MSLVFVAAIVLCFVYELYALLPFAGILVLVSLVTFVIGVLTWLFNGGRLTAARHPLIRPKGRDPSA
jgi:hypothetical protein